MNDFGAQAEMMVVQTILMACAEFSPRENMSDSDPEHLNKLIQQELPSFGSSLSTLENSQLPLLERFFKTILAAFNKTSLRTKKTTVSSTYRYILQSRVDRFPDRLGYNC